MAHHERSTRSLKALVLCALLLAVNASPALAGCGIGFPTPDELFWIIMETAGSVAACIIWLVYAMTRARHGW